MSSTKRGGQRRPDDFYRTPRWAIEVLLDAQVVHLVGPILEPGCGDGAIIDVLQDHGFRQIIGVEMSLERASVAASILQNGAIVCDDFLTAPQSQIEGAAPAYRIQAAIGNPPFNEAEAFILKALDLVKPGGPVVFLLRLAFLAGQKRAKSGLWDHLHGVYVLPRRPSFTGEGTDSSDYAWFVFRRDEESFREELREMGLPVRSGPASLGHLGDGR